jgi:hypothetical protein
VVIPIRDQPSLDAFRVNNRVSFSLVLGAPPENQFDLPANQFYLPANQFELKVEALHVALVGATSTKGVLNTFVRHGGRYLMVTREGFDADQLLEPHSALAPAQFTRLQITGTPVSNGMGGELNSVSFWGRGLGGEWEISIQQDDRIADNVDLSGLTEIQIWIATQAFIPVN